MSAQDAFLRFNLAPLQLRRDIGMLGALWKIAHGQAHIFLTEMFPLCGFQRDLPSTRGVKRRHNLRFVDRCAGAQLEQFSRSLFGLVRVWNDLPEKFVTLKTVKGFQIAVTRAARDACAAGVDNWERMFATDSFPRLLLREFCVQANVSELHFTVHILNRYL